MTTSQIYSLIDQLKTCGTQRLGLTGGEATLRDDIGKIITYSKKRGLITTLCSNGKIVEGKILELRALDILLLSLDGPKEIHNKFRGEGSYESVIRTIEIAKNQGINIWLTTLLMKENIGHIDYIVDLAHSYNIQCSFQPVVDYSGSGKNIKNFFLTKDELRSVFKKLIDYKRANRSIAISQSYLKYMYKFWPEINAQNLSCFAGKLFCIITPGGYVFPCQPLEIKNKTYNVLNSDFKKAFYSLPNFICQHCFCDSFIEANLLFNANFFTMWNIFKIFILR
jgi:MoaA/NifB/PqqE/SkfB family radical SAM enzyme